MEKQLVTRILLFMPTLGASILILISFWVAGIIVNRIIKRMARRADPSRKEVVTLLGKISKWVIIIVGLITAAGTMGINVSAFIAGLGLTGFALGYALKDAISNLVAGLLILSHRPFKQNDRISVADFEGKVVSIDFRYTTLEIKDKIVLIPNSALFTKPIVVIGASHPEE